MSHLLARYAEGIFWLARYVERIENLARIIDVQETFSRDSQGLHDWASVVELNGDRERFAEHHGEATAENVLRFYVLDRDNPTSIVFSLRAARENARMLRSLITTEMWAQINVFYNRCLALGPADLAEERLARTCALIKDGCEAHAGITGGTFYRDEAWNFYELGRAIECADQTTRLLDAKFYSLQGRAARADGAVDVSQWTAVLRSAAGFQAYRRRHVHGVRPEDVAAFLYSDWRLPRSVAHCLGVIEQSLTELRRQHGVRGTTAALEHLDGLRDDLHVDKVKAVVATGGLHQFNDWLQRGLIELTSLLGRSFFGHDAAPAQSQSQGQTQAQR
ncbi:MAG: alpha-E domain-containing protein [Geminicoccaceae bacterium]